MARTKVNKDHPAFTTDVQKGGVVTTDILDKEPVKGNRKVAEADLLQPVDHPVESTGYQDPEEIAREQQLEKLKFLREYLEAGLKDVDEEIAKLEKG